ncbi:MAG: sigma-54-dependent Fis family transcriptional regulator [Deltaproteobacteria bacterium]|nr:MAG: sigma-54-dependent Fis family transcriptional regulator [Deltaproteobacteria bacterium]
MSGNDINYSQYPVMAVDDERDNLDVIRYAFKQSHPLLFAESGAEAMATLEKHPVAAIVSDQRMPAMSGLELLAQARKLRPDAVGVLLTAYGDVPMLAEAINSGLVYRYVQKPFDASDLGSAIKQAVEKHHLVIENRRLVDRLARHNEYLKREEHVSWNGAEIVGQAPPLAAALELVRRVAPTTATVLLRGESGTGKELIARMIHSSSARTNRPFVRVNCAALASSVLESELFGHERGSFTGAVARRSGRFELAHEGTLFLDEVGDMSSELQVKLLRVLQEREFERVGGAETLRVDVRVISATNRDLEAAMAAGTFREDLFYRLNVFPIRVPPLRERPGDIEGLAGHFLARFVAAFGRSITGLRDDAVEKLCAYEWPGNVRELENVIERAVILARGMEISGDDLDFGVRPLPDREPPRVLDHALAEMERKSLVDALGRHHGHKADVARDLGINRSTLYYRLRKYGIQ